jgi:hypothetical protein
MESIFPIRDGPSAQFMSLKAECLHSAGLISKSEERAVLGKAAKALTASKQLISQPDHTPACVA